MSYAQVASQNREPLESQPKPDPALLNTASDPIQIDPLNKVNVVPSKDVVPMSSSAPAPPAGSSVPRHSGSHRRAHSAIDETRAEGIYLYESAKHYLLRPGVAGGLIGLVNIGLMAGAARAFYVQPHLRRDTTAISTTVAATLALLGVEGYAAEAYSKTAAGQEEARRAKEEGAMIYRQAKEQILRPGTLGGLVGIINLAVLGTIGYFSYENWDRPWDRRMVSAVSAGLLTLSVGEGFLAEKYNEQRKYK